MKSRVSEPESWKRIVDIEVPHDEVERLFEEKLQKVRRTIALDGFRPGKVPLPLIRQRYGEAVRSDVIDDIVQKAFKDACAEKSIVPVSKGVVSNLSAEAGKPLTCSVETEVDPPIDIKGYDRRKVKVSPKKITDGDVDGAVESLRERFAEFGDAGRPARKGDYVRLEYLKVVIDGQERKDVKSPSYPVEIGAEHRIRDFDKGLAGHAAGETVAIDVKFPADYSDREVAGKMGEFTVRLLAVQEKTLPPVASFLKQLGDFADDEALRAELRKKLERDALEQARSEAYAEAIDMLIKNNPFEVPPSRIEAFYDYLMERAAAERRPGEPVPAREEISGRYRDTAVRSIKRQRIIDFIAAKENIAATQEEVDAEIRKLAGHYRQPFDAFKQTLRRNGATLRIRDDLKEQKTLDFLVTLPEVAK